ncbi:hypothetical protein E4634_04945 [Mangrovimicrobium sediminis]|uniref:Nitrogen fixation protein FixH n=1 Tax=Mangrovimicrobium sediminis TaxID=2562682 RepID=A0A4Z0M531_9GAMM|nr:FixH family protein [Haliea sp. SAOS-164]TGD74556.1 hypothetical protein E4634_04945 [Haliea sp. SAOS-164]
MARPIPREDSTPWYRQFWPWFLIGLPSVVVVASLTTVYIATEGADDLVDDNYYKDGLAINRELASLEQAAAAGISAALQIDGDQIVVLTQGPVDAPQLQLQLAHPMEADRDIQLTLVQSTPGEYRGRLGTDVAPRWHWNLQPAGGDAWRLEGSLSPSNFQHQGGG